MREDRAWKILRRVVAVLALCIQCTAAAEPPDAPEVARAEDVLALGRSEARKRAQRVRVEGVITFVSPDRPWFYLQDDSAGILVLQNLFLTKVKIGQKAEVTGRTNGGSFAPYIDLTEDLREAFVTARGVSWVQFDGELQVTGMENVVIERRTGAKGFDRPLRDAASRRGPPAAIEGLLIKNETRRVQAFVPPYNLFTLPVLTLEDNGVILEVSGPPGAEKALGALPTDYRVQVTGYQLKQPDRPLHLYITCHDIATGKTRWQITHQRSGYGDVRAPIRLAGARQTGVIAATLSVDRPVPALSFQTAVVFNRRMRKTARPVVWEP